MNLILTVDQMWKYDLRLEGIKLLLKIYLIKILKIFSKQMLQFPCQHLMQRKSPLSAVNT